MPGDHPNFRKKGIGWKIGKGADDREVNLENRRSVVGLLPSPAGTLKTCMRPG
jgi:hypothetical protein